MRALVAVLCGGMAVAVISGAQGLEKTRLCFVGANDLVDASAPQFDHYAIEASPAFATTKLNLRSNPIAKTFRSVIRRQTREGPNFAGHYRVAVWGCGSSCAQFAIVNLKTGRVLTAEGVRNVSGVHFEVDGFMPSAESEFGLFRFRKDSRLLVVLGAINEDDSREGAFYYVLKGEKLQLIHETKAKRNTCQKENNY